MKAKMSALIAASCILGLGCGDQSRPDPTSTGGSSGQAPSAQETGKGPTVAPDLVAVDRLRPGPKTDGGDPTTLVNFRFDQKAYLTDGDRTNFKLVPKDGGEIIDGTGEKPNNERRGESLVTVVFPGDLAERDIARGYVDAGKVSSSDPGNGPTNVLQARRVGASGGTPAPDLVSVTRNGDELRFKFDAKIDPEQVNDTGGFRAYDADAKTYKVNTARRSGADPGMVVVTFDDFDVANAVGASVNQGAVEVSHDGIEWPNTPDEAPLSE